MSGIRARSIAAAAGLLLIVGLVLPAAAVAADPSYRVVVSGLHSPRGLSFGPGGILYAAESGDAVPGARRRRRAQSLETEDEKNGGDDVRDRDRRLAGIKHAAVPSS